MTVISTDISAGGAGVFTFTAASQLLIVEGGVTVENTGFGAAVFDNFANSRIANGGALVSAAGAGVQLEVKADYAFLVNGNDGLILGTDGVRSKGSDTMVSNNGDIVGVTGSGVYVGDIRSQIDNHLGGVISGIQAGVTAQGKYFRLSNQGEITATQSGVDLAGESGFISNASSGTIVGAVSGLLAGLGARINNWGSITGVNNAGVMVNAANVKLVNDGLIEGGLSGVIVKAGATNALIHNHGVIHSDQIGVWLSAGAGTPATLINSGIIEATQTAVLVTDPGTAKVTNTGLIAGGVTLGAGADTMRNSGEIIGAVQLLGGADVYNGRGGSVSVFISGGDGADILTAGDGDLLLGQEGNDQLRGGGSENTLIGGAGADRLQGGHGADAFVFQAVSESTTLSQDTIARFSRAQGDYIDLSALDANTAMANDQGFILVRGELSGTTGLNGEGELRVAVVGGRTIVQGDVNADGLADFELTILSTDYLDENDFIL